MRSYTRAIYLPRVSLTRPPSPSDSAASGASSMTISASSERSGSGTGPKRVYGLTRATSKPSSSNARNPRPSSGTVDAGVERARAVTPSCSRSRARCRAGAMLGSMAPTATGSIVAHLRKDGLTSYWLRFRAYGERHRIVLGTDEDGWTRKRAEAELRNVLARVDAGIWRPPEKRSEPDGSPLAPRFHAFASEWFDARLPELAPKTQIDYYYRWRLSNHVLPFFHAK